MIIKKVYIYTMLYMLSPHLYARDCYLLTAPMNEAGFFSTFNTVIGAFDFVEQHDADIIIDFEKRGYYYDSTVGDNWWSYYFEPVGQEFKTVQKPKKFYHYKKVVFTLFAQFDLSRQRANDLIKKYVKLKPHIQQKIDTFVFENFEGYYVIGVHYRGTDKSVEAPKISYQQMCDTVVEVMQRGYQLPVKIFVATDDALFLEYIQDLLPDVVCAIDAIRSRDEKSVHMNELVENYKKGEDALLDCMLLSKANFLVKMTSNLSDVSMQFNPDIQAIRLNSCYFE